MPKLQSIRGLCRGLFATGTCLGATAQIEGDVSIDEVFACTAIDDALERVACYDAAVGRFKAADDAGEVTVVAKSEVEEIQREAFGFNLPSLPRFVASRSESSEAAKIEAIEVPVSQVVRLRSDNLRVALENGQIWEQTDGKRVQYSARLGVESAEIQRAAFGSYKMKLDSGPAFRVKRIQ